MAIKKYLQFIEVPNTGKKTKIFKIKNNSGEYLGRIFWYVPWRQYCWQSDRISVWSTDCDKQRTEFIDELNKKHKENNKNNKSNKNNS